MPLQRRLPKRGFKNPFRREYNIINVRDLNRFPAGTVVDLATLKDSGLVKRAYWGVKVLGEGTISQPLTVQAHHYSLAAKNKIEAAGGKAEVI
jgi:large subunit ribosomal protein L15